MTPLDDLRALYFKASAGTIDDDLRRAIALFKQLTTEQEREKAAVYMDGIAELRKEWQGSSRPPSGRPRRR